jgi:DDE superfamily endonuclease
MLPPASLPMPATWRDLLDELAPVFARRSTHRLFVALACGMILADRSTVVAMAAAAGMADRWRRACWFFAGAAWDIDDLGLVVARLVVGSLLAGGEPVVVAVDGTFFKRWGRKVFQARWAYDGSAQGGKKIAFGNTWVIAAIVVRLPFCSSPVALPVLFRLWRGKGTASQVELAAAMVKLLAGAFPGRPVHGTGDAAFHGGPLAGAGGATWTTRLPANAVLYGPRPPRTGKRGRPRAKGDRLGTCAQIAQDADWQDTVVNVYGHDTAVQIAAVEGLWHGSFKTAPGRIVLVRDPGSPKPYDLALFTLDTGADPAAITERYSWRWPIEPSNATGKQILGVGDACNRTEKAVQRTVPFGFLVQSLLITWYARCAYSPADIDRRRRLCPWYRTKTEPSAADMLARLRRDFLTARFSAIPPGRDGNDQIDLEAWTCDSTAA